MITYRLIDAYPISVDNIRLGYENSDIMRVSVTLGYTRYITLDHAGTGNSQNPFNAKKSTICIGSCNKSTGSCIWCSIIVFWRHFIE